MGDEWKARPDRPTEVPLLHLQLGEQLERLRQEPTWRASGRNAITLAKEPALRVVLMLLGTRGSLVDAFGAYSNPTVSAFLHDVPIRRTVERDAAGSA